jgi:hypothetical protein
LLTSVAKTGINIHLFPEFPNGEEVFYAIFPEYTGCWIFIFDFYFCTLFVFYEKKWLCLKIEH